MRNLLSHSLQKVAKQFFFRFSIILDGSLDILKSKSAGQNLKYSTSKQPYRVFSVHTLYTHLLEKKLTENKLKYENVQIKWYRSAYASTLKQGHALEICVH